MSVISWRLQVACKCRGEARGLNPNDQIAITISPNILVMKDGKKTFLSGWASCDL